MKFLKNLEHRQFNNNPNLSLFFYKYTPLFFCSNDKEAKQKFLSLFQHGQIRSRFDLVKNRSDRITQIASKSIRLRTVARFICGIGYTSTVEWGMNFDWTSGVPYLPGSSFKGAVLSYLEFAKGKPVQKWNPDENSGPLEISEPWSRKEIYDVFGPQGRNDPPDTGGVIFFDAYPINNLKLEVDIITPHYKNYYSDKDNKIPPADTENPTPIPFLTIARSVEFLFAFKVRDSQKVDNTIAEKLKKLIIEVGECYGFGAKTSSGYGYFERIHSDG